MSKHRYLLHREEGYFSDDFYFSSVAEVDEFFKSKLRAFTCVDFDWAHKCYLSSGDKFSRRWFVYQELPNLVTGSKSFLFMLGRDLNISWNGIYTLTRLY